MKGFDAPLWYRLNPDGTTEPADPDDPRSWSQPIEERRIGKTMVRTGRVVWQAGKLTLRWRPEDVEVSTVFLSLDHAHFGGPPILFETMVFGGEHDQWQDRYATLEQARRGHARVVENLRAGRDPGYEP